jgi:hypothetical protein
MSFLGIRARVAFASVLSLVAGCATARVVTEPRGPARYFLRCQTPLPVCLTEGAAPACQGNHYVVERAVDEVNERGDTVTPTIYRTSEALIHCGPSHVWSGIDTKVDQPMAGAAVAAPLAPTAAPAHACTPGATQTCVGPGACQGGQACLGDGSAFGPCDCGARPAAPPAP